MLSDLLDVLGLSLGVAGAFVLLGLGAALLAAMVAVMFVAYSVDDDAAGRTIARLARRARAAVTAPARAVRDRRSRARAA